MKEYDLNQLLNNPEKVQEIIKTLQQKEILQVQKPDPSEIEGHLLKSRHNLRFCSQTKPEFYDWTITGCYYACYHAFYSLLQKAGIRCEIHDCTLELMKFFDFNTDDLLFMQRLKSDRVAVQYYLEKNKKAVC